jgi:peptidoglycan/LPS O-acetylase OafA/YrhL
VFGGLLAGIEARGLLPRRLRLPLFGAGAVLVAFVWDNGLTEVLGWSEHVRQTFLFDVVSFGYALTLPAAAAFVRPPRWLAAVAGVISRQSYCLYLIYLTILEMTGLVRGPHHWSASFSVFIVLAAIFGLSWASSRWFEQPILDRRPPQPDGQIG